MGARAVVEEVVEQGTGVGRIAGVGERAGFEQLGQFRCQVAGRVGGERASRPGDTQQFRQLGGSTRLGDMAFEGCGGAPAGAVVDFPQRRLGPRVPAVALRRTGYGRQLETALEVEVLCVALGDPQPTPHLLQHDEPRRAGPKRIGLRVHQGREQRDPVLVEHARRQHRMLHRPKHQRIQNQLHRPAQRSAIGPAQRVDTIDLSPHLIEHHGARSPHPTRL